MNSLPPAIRYPLAAVRMVILSLLEGAAFFFGAMLSFFVAAAMILYMIIAGALILCGLFGLLCWLFLHDRNAMRGFFMFALYTAVWLSPVFLVRNLFRAAMKPRDAPYLDARQQVYEQPQVLLASGSSPWMRNNPSGTTTRS